MGILNIKYVNPTGMFSYGLSENIPLEDSGIVHVVGINEDKGGDSNGAGKSSLFNAICELLFQENPTGEKGDAVVNKVWNNGMAGRIEFNSLDGHLYRVTYFRDWKGTLYEPDNDTNTKFSGTGLYLDKFSKPKGVWENITGSGMPDTRKKIADIVGMEYERFLAISYMTNRSGNVFLRGTNKDRMDLLAGIVGIDEWDKVSDACRKERKSCKDFVDGKKSEISYKEGSLQATESHYENLKSVDYVAIINALEAEIANKRIEYSSMLETLRETRDEFKKVQEQSNKAVNGDLIEAWSMEVDRKNNEITQLENEAYRIRAVEDPSLNQEMMRIHSEYSQFNTLLRSAQNESNILLNHDNCPTCNSVISESVKNAIKQERENRIAQYQNQVDTSGADYQEIQLRIANSKQQAEAEAEQKKSAIRERIAVIRKEIEAFHANMDNENSKGDVYLQQLQNIDKDIFSIQAKLTEIQSYGEMKVSESKQAKAKLDEIGTVKETIKGIKKEIKALKKEVKNADNDLVILNWVIGNIPSIKLHKMAVSMQHISNAANEYLSETGDSVRINISAFSEKANAKNSGDIESMLKKEVEVTISDGEKIISPKLYSDGEMAKISLAISKALHDIAKVSSQGCNLMILDEIFSFIDANNSQRIANSLTDVMNGGTVLLTDNSDKVRDLVRFDKVWTARKKDGKTVMEVS